MNAARNLEAVEIFLNVLDNTLAERGVKESKRHSYVKDLFKIINREEEIRKMDRYVELGNKNVGLVTFKGSEASMLMEKHDIPKAGSRPIAAAVLGYDDWNPSKTLPVLVIAEIADVPFSIGEKLVKHEMCHVDQMLSGKLIAKHSGTTWNDGNRVKHISGEEEYELNVKMQKAMEISGNLIDELVYSEITNKPWELEAYGKFVDDVTFSDLTQRTQEVINHYRKSIGLVPLG